MKYIYICILFLLLFTVIPISASVDGNTKYKNFTANSSMISGTNAELPLELYINISTGISSDGGNIRITYINGTKIPREVKKYNNDYITVWFAPENTTSAENTTYRIWYGNEATAEPDVDSEFGRNAVWDNNCVGVWHLDQEPNMTSSMLDSTGNGFNLTPYGFTTNSSVSMPYGIGIDFDGNDDGLYHADNDAFDGYTSMSLLAQYNYTSGLVNDAIVGKSYTGTISYVIRSFTTGGQIQTLISTDATSNSSLFTGNHDGVTHTVIMNYNGSGLRSRNDAEIDNTIASGTIHNSEEDFTIGMLKNGASMAGNFPGIISEVRLQNTSRSSDWDATTYNNLHNPTATGVDAFYLSIGEEQTSDVTPSITSTSPSTPTTSFVNESKTFNAGSDQSGNWTWYVDSILKKSSETNTTNGTYTNSTAPNGTTINVTAIITNVNGSTQTSWNWTPLQNYITTNVTYSDGNNLTIVHIINVSYYTPGTTQWGFNFSWTNTGQQYDWTYTNSTIIQSLTASSTNETLEFMHAPPLPTGIYYIQKSLATSTTTIPANAWGMFNNWTSTMTFAGIAANESNDVCYTYYNVTSGLWESYYIGYSWNADYQLSKDASVMGYFDAQTDITSNIITPSSTELYTGWNILGIQSSSNQTISGIIADIGTNCSDSWYFNSSTDSYSNATTHGIQPNRGFLAYITQNMTWTRSAM